MNRVLEVNRDLKHRFDILETYEAGLQLLGYEVKAIKEKKFNMSKAFVRHLKGELWLVNFIVNATGPWIKSNKRAIKLLLKKNEIVRIFSKSREKGLTVLPYELYVNSRGLIKVRIALVKHKKKYERKEEIKRRDIERELLRKYKV